MDSKIREAQSSITSMEATWKKLWKMKVPNKIRFFCWRALNEIIPSNIKLKKRGIEITPTCPLCKCYPESTNHALLTCSKAKAV